MALAKYDLVRIWNNYRFEEKQKGIPKKVADREFLITYNTCLLYSKIFNVLGNISIGALYRWKMLLDKNPDWTTLVGNYNYTANGCYRTSLNENEIKMFLNILLSPNKFSVGRAISLTQYILKEKNAENIPTEVTFRRYAKWYKTNNLDKWTLARDGMKALKDKVEPLIACVRKFLGVTNYMYYYNNQTYISKKKLFSKFQEQPFLKSDMLEFKKDYSKLTRRVNHNSMQNFVHLHLAEQIFRFNHDYDEVYEEITRFI